MRNTNNAKPAGERVFDDDYRKKSDKNQMYLAAAEYFCQGKQPEQILDLIRKEFPELARSANRETPKRWIQQAINHGWLEVDAPFETKMERALADAYQWMPSRIRVVESRPIEHVAAAAAKHLLELVRNLRSFGRRDSVHIGVAGGRLMQLMARIFATSLEEDSMENPETITIHAMVAGFDNKDYWADPNSFMAYFDPDKVSVDVRFVRIAGPGIVETDLRGNLREYREIAEAYEAARKLDIIVSGGGDWEDDHSTSQHYIRRAHADDVKAWSCENAVGDFLWQPISEEGPIDLDVKNKFKFRPHTLVDLKQLPDYISDGTRVMLALGPCGECGKPKGKLLDTMMSADMRLMTDVVTSSPTARYALQRSQAQDGVLPKKG